MEAIAVCLAITMAKEADLEGQLGRFPPREVTAAWCDFSQSHIDWLLDQCKRGTEAERNVLLPWLREARTCRKTWMFLRSAQDRSRPIEGRLKSFLMLRIWLPPKDFSQGKMPPPVPLHRFREGSPPKPAPIEYDGITQAEDDNLE